MKDDTLVKYINDSNNLRIIAIDASITVDDARIRHRLFLFRQLPWGAC